MVIDLREFKSTLSNNFVIIATSNGREKNAVNKQIRYAKAVELGFSTKGSKLGIIDNTLVLHISGTSGISSELSISRLINDFVSNDLLPIPSCIFLVGFCWGNPIFSKIGDVIVSNSIWSINSQVRKKDEITFKEKTYSNDLSIDKICESIDSRVLSGEISSAEELIESTSYRDLIITKNPKILGGEMEAFGFVPSLNTRKISWLVIKSVSDLGDDNFNQQHQEVAAHKAAELLPSIIRELISAEEIKGSKVDSLTLSFKNLLIGNTINADVTKITSDALNDYLNNTLGPIVFYKVSAYASYSPVYGEKLLHFFTALILESLQNIFRYGGKLTARVSFSDDQIIIDAQDDFELNLLSGEGGGAESWLDFKEAFIDTDLITYKFNKRKHKFKLNRINHDLKIIINNCSAQILENTIGSGYSNRPIIKYSPECESIFIDDRQILMPSRRFTIFDAIRGAVKEGVNVFVAVNSQRQLETYKKHLFDIFDKVEVIVEARISRLESLKI